MTISTFMIGKRSSGRFVTASTRDWEISRSWRERAAPWLVPLGRLGGRNSAKYGHGSWTRMLIDATINWQLEPQEQYGGQRYPAVGTAISREMADKLKRRWKEYGF